MKESDKTAMQLAMEGAQQAAEHADEVHGDWTEQALALFRQYAQANPYFMTEDARVWANKQGLAAPPAPQAWGHVVIRAKREGIIHAEPNNYAQTKVKPAHSTPRPVWRSLICKGVTIDA